MTTLEGGSESRERHKGRRRDQESRNFLFFFIGVCVNDCGRRLSGKVESFKCCRVSVVFGIFLLLVCYCARFAFGVFVTVTVYVLLV